MYFHWSLLLVWCWAGQGERTTLSPLASKHRAPMGPHRTSPTEFRSQCWNGDRENVHPVLLVILHFFSFTSIIIILNCCHGYLVASTTARCYVHGPALYSLPSGVVCTAAAADIVQLQTDTKCDTLQLLLWNGKYAFLKVCTVYV